MKSIIKEFIPPIVLNTLRPHATNVWFGDYHDWKSASKESTNYNSSHILDRVTESLLKVKNGEALFERDSVTFNKMEYEFPLLASLFYVTNRSKNLNVLDFGGSLGSTYFQYKNIFNNLDVNWYVVEQEHFVDRGKKTFENSKLKFLKSIDEIDSPNDIDVVLIRNSLQYTQDPYGILQTILAKKIKYLLFDLVAFNAEPKDRLTIQKVPKQIYEASYPCWFLNESKFLEMVNHQYINIWEIPGQKIANIPSQHKGYLFERKK